MEDDYLLPEAILNSADGENMYFDQRLRLTDSVKLADEWYDHLGKIRAAMDFNRKERQNPVRVAILDTGVDLGHPDIVGGINTKIKSWKGFPDTSDFQPLRDTNGHGTYLACVLMRTAPNACLYIARVFNDAKQCNYGEIAKV